MRAAVLAFLMVLIPAAAPAQTPAPVYGFTWIAPSTGGTPQIIRVELNSNHLRAGGPIAIRVTTSPDVVKVFVGNGKHSGALTQLAPGTFVSSSSLPHLGGFATVAIPLHFTATDAAGKSTSVDVPVTYR